MRKPIVGLLAVVAILAACSASQAAVITSPGGGYKVGIATNGELFVQNPTTLDEYVGFQRASDKFDPISVKYDPIMPGVPRDSWGVSAGADAGWANHTKFGVSNINLNSTVIGANTAFISTFLTGSGGNLLEIDQSLGFVAGAENVLKIATKVTNVSGVSQPVRFSRGVDFDIGRTPPFDYDISKSDTATWGVLNASYYGFEHPNPLTPFGSPCATAGGVYGPGEVGAAFQLDLGTLGPGASSFFDVFYAINTGPTESADGLRQQLHNLGADFVITTEGTDSGTNSAALAVQFVPEPLSIIVWSILGVVGITVGWRRWRKAA